MKIKQELISASDNALVVNQVQQKRKHSVFEDLVPSQETQNKKFKVKFSG